MGLATVAAAAVPGAFRLRSYIASRQQGGARVLAGTLHLNARWWNEQRAKDGALLYVAVGDSAAQGIGASLPGRSYVGLIAKHLRAATGQSVRVVNLSASGARLRDAIELQLPALRDLQPDILTVAIGANDIASFNRARFESELNQIFTALPAGAVIADIPAFYLGANERNVRIANSIVRRLARQYHFAVAPLHRRTLRQGVARYALNQVAADFFHPNDRGYRVWASAFLPIIDGLLLLNTPFFGPNEATGAPVEPE